jgi:acyl-CoA thioesterase
MQAQKPEAPLRSLQVSFVGPINDEHPLDLASTVLRSGKNVTAVSGVGSQNFEAKIAALGCFGASRKSQVSVPPEPPRVFFPELKDIDDVEAMPRRPWEPGVTPSFAKNFEFVYLSALPYSGQGGKVLRGFVRHASPNEFPGERPGECSSVSLLLGLLDSWPPPVLCMVDKPTMASSLTMSLDIVHPNVQLNDGEWVQYEGRIEHSANGHATVAERVWNCDGELLVISQQNAVHFA